MYLSRVNIILHVWICICDKYVCTYGEIEQHMGGMYIIMISFQNYTIASYFL